MPWFLFDASRQLRVTEAVERLDELTGEWAKGRQPRFVPEGYPLPPATYAERDAQKPPRTTKAEKKKRFAAAKAKQIRRIQAGLPGLSAGGERRELEDLFTRQAVRRDEELTVRDPLIAPPEETSGKDAFLLAAYKIWNSPS